MPFMSSVAAGVIVLALAAPGVAGPRQRAGAQPSAPQAQQAPAPAATPQAPVLPVDQPITAGQIQRWFEAFTALQAQERLQLSEAQYFKFMTRLQVLQETRRNHQQAHQRILNDLRKLTNPETGSNDEAAITERLKALREEDAAAVVEIAKAYEGVDETLDMRQQARFRIFEDQVEQQKLELLMRARQNARAAARGKKGG
jgi:hypothetical protein